MDDKVHFFDFAPEAYLGKIPFIPMQLMEAMEQKNCNQVPGLFRINPNDTEAKKLVLELDSGESIDWTKYDIHTIGAGLRRYFRNITEKWGSFIPTDVLKQIDIDKARREGRENNEFSKILKLLNRVRAGLLSALCKFLHGIAANQAVNQMTESNLAICMAPNLISSESKENSQITYILHKMIEHYDKVFIKYPVDPKLFCTPEDINIIRSKPLEIPFIDIQITKIKTRSYQAIPFVPVCRIIKDPAFERPTRHYQNPKTVKANLETPPSVGKKRTSLTKVPKPEEFAPHGPFGGFELSQEDKELPTPHDEIAPEEAPAQEETKADTGEAPKPAESLEPNKSMKERLDEMFKAQFAAANAKMPSLPVLPKVDADSANQEDGLFIPCQTMQRNVRKGTRRPTKRPD